MKDIAVELSDGAVEACEGVEIWEKSVGISDYVLVTADKPRNSPKIPI